VAARLFRPSIRNPFAPPASAASAIAMVICGLSIGPSSTGWQETTKPPESFSSTRMIFRQWPFHSIVIVKADASYFQYGLMMPRVS